MCLAAPSADTLRHLSSTNTSKHESGAIGPHTYHLVLIGEPIPGQLSAPPSASSRDTFDRNGEKNDLLEAVRFAGNHDPLSIDYSLLNDTMVTFNITLDQRLNDLDDIWQDYETTIFDLYDVVGRASIPLNYPETGSNMFIEGHTKRVLLIPLASPDQTVIQVHEPQIQSADLYIL